MKRSLSFLLALTFLLSLCACGQKPSQQPPSGGESELPPPAAPIHLSLLNVEFVKGERDTGALLELKKTLPPLLIAALAEQDVTVDAVSITFGTSAEATAQALSMGSVQVGFLPSSAFCAYSDALHAVADRGNSSASHIGLYLPYGEQNQLFLEKLTSLPWTEAFSRDDLAGAKWAVPADDEVAERYLARLLEEQHALLPEDLADVSFYADLAQRDEALKETNLLVLYGLDLVSSGVCAVVENISLESETVAVSAADEIVGSEAFRAALQNALAALCADEAGQAALALYSGGEYANYHAVDNEAYAAQRYVLGYTEK